MGWRKIAPLVAGLMEGFDAFVAPPPRGKNIAPRVAALLDVMQVSEILSVEGPKPSPARSMRAI
jgi:electron transfer flavoprotein alpha subunit